MDRVVGERGWVGGRWQDEIPQRGLQGDTIQVGDVSHLDCQWLAPKNNEIELN